MANRLGSARNHALDFMRGLFVISMTFEHLAPSSVPSVILHLPVTFDGASGFILMSGLVLGMVQRSRWSLGGEVTVWKSLLRRAAELFLIHTALIAVALLMGAVGSHQPWIPELDAYPDPVALILALGSLSINPPNIDILSTYVILLILLLPAASLLGRGRWRAVLVLSATVYVVAQVMPLWTALPRSPSEPSFFNWGAWQLLFILAFVGGWHWRERNLEVLIRTRPMVLAAAGSALLTSAWAVLATAQGGQAAALWTWGSAKGDAGPIRLLMAIVGFVIVYFVVSALHRQWSGLQGSFIELIGRKSLLCFVLLSAITIVFGDEGGGRTFLEGLLPYGAVLLMALTARSWAGSTSSAAGLSGRRLVPTALLAARPALQNR